MPETETSTEAPVNFIKAIGDAAKAELAEKAAAQGGTAPAVAPDKTEPAVAPKVETKPVEAKVEPAKAAPDPDDEIMTGKKSPKGEDFKRVKTFAKQMEKEAADTKAKLAEMDKELATLRKKPVQNSEEIAKLQKERDEAVQFRDTVALEWHPDFQAKYQNRIASEISKLKGVMDEATGQKLAALITQPDSEWKRKAMEEMAENLTPYQLSRIGAVDANISGILSEREAELGKSKESLTKIAQDRAAQSKAAQEQRQAQFKSFIEKQKSDNPMFKTREGDEAKDWNTGVNERLAIAEAAWSGQLQGDDLADLIARGTTAHVWAEQNKAANARIAELEGVLAKLQGSSPSLEGGGKTEPTGEVPGFFKVMKDAAKHGPGQGAA